MRPSIRCWAEAGETTFEEAGTATTVLPLLAKGGIGEGAAPVAEPELFTSQAALEWQERMLVGQEGRDGLPDPTRGDRIVPVGIRAGPQPFRLVEQGQPLANWDQIDASIA